MRLRKPEHFQIFKGKRIKVKLFQKIQGLKTATGNIIKSNKEGVSLKIVNTNNCIQIPFSHISKANLEPEIKI